MKNRAPIWTGAASTVLLAGLISAYFGSSLMSGAAVITSYLIHRKGVKIGRLKGRTDKLKAANSFNDNLIELAGISSAVFFTSGWPIIFAVASVGLNRSFLQEIKNKSVGLKTELIGRTERIILIGLSLISSYFNEYILIYGLVAVGFTALFESTRQLFFLLKK